MKSLAPVVGSICSGMGAVELAWSRLGWRFAFSSEVAPEPSAVLAHHRPETPNLGDFTTIGRSAGPIDVLVGGTPCQGFSVAGLRKGLADDRSNLALQFLRLAERLGPAWVVWENVPGVLSTNGGRDFGAFLGGLEELGYGWAYRTLDAQYVRVDGFGRAVPQRRRRVFVVGRLGDWRGAAAVLFERESLCGNPPPRREAGQDAASTLTAGVGSGGGGPRVDPSTELVACTIPASNGGASSGYHPVVPVVIPFDERNVTSKANRTKAVPGLPCGTLHESPHAIAFQERGRADGRNIEWQEDVSYALRAIDGGGCGDWFRIAWRWAVRRLTPRECERLQGFPDDWTLVPHRGKPMADGPRYKMCGNSMAVNVMTWLGVRLGMVMEAAP